MKSKIGIILIAFVFSLVGCTDIWDEHYNKQPETINMNVWDAIKSKSELSRFVELMVKYKYDTLFLTNDTYTIFAPDNAAIEKLMQTEDIGTTVLNYHISRHYVKPVDITGKRKLQTLAEKYSTFENIGGNPTIDGIVLKEESPLYINGKFFVLGEVAAPKLNIYEYFAENLLYMKSYIDKEDSIILDKEKSRPIGFDENGNTVYDSVSVTVNLFEMMFFPVSEEYRNWTATFVLPRKATYENGLNVMAQKLGGTFNDYTDIPVEWQEDVLIPHLVKHGTFLNMLEPNEFKGLNDLTFKKKFNMVNINGDSIVCNYVPTDKYLASNGVLYDYQNFEIPDSLFSGSEKYEGEWLAYQTGINKYAWKNNVDVFSTTFFEVQKSLVKGQASNDSILVVNFSKGYTGTYRVQFNVRNLFPRKYQMVITTHMDIGGIYDIYVNDVLVKRKPTDVNSFDYYDYVVSRGLLKSVTGSTFVPKGRYNKFDFWVENITDYGRPNIRFEYKGPGRAPGNGLAIDLIEFIPAN